jgi:hypothetical protein
MEQQIEEKSQIPINITKRKFTLPKLMFFDENGEIKSTTYFLLLGTMIATSMIMQGI